MGIGESRNGAGERCRRAIVQRGRLGEEMVHTTAPWRLKREANVSAQETNRMSPGRGGGGGGASKEKNGGGPAGGENEKKRMGKKNCWVGFSTKRGGTENAFVETHVVGGGFFGFLCGGFLCFGVGGGVFCWVLGGGGGGGIFLVVLGGGG